VHHFEGFWMYNDAILDAFGETGTVNEARWYSRAAFER
jgi:hypothetical protein